MFRELCYAQIMLFSSVSCLMANNSSADGGKVQNLTMTVSSEQQSILPGEPYLLTVTIKNLTGNPIPFKVKSMTNFLLQKNIVVVKREKGEERYCYFAQHLAAAKYWEPKAQVESFDAGSEIVLQELMFGNRSSGYPFSECGLYQIQYEFMNENTETGAIEEVYSNTIALNVNEPTGDDKILSEIFLQNDKGDIYLPITLFVGGEKRLDKNYGTYLDEMTKKYPNSKFAPYMSYLLARSRINDKDAVGIYEDLTKKEGFILSAQCHLELAHCYKVAGERQKAASIMGDFQKKFKDHPSGKAVPAPWMRSFVCKNVSQHLW